MAVKAKLPATTITEEMHTTRSLLSVFYPLIAASVVSRGPKEQYDKREGAKEVTDHLPSALGAMLSYVVEKFVEDSGVGPGGIPTLSHVFDAEVSGASAAVQPSKFSRGDQFSLLPNEARRWRAVALASAATGLQRGRFCVGVRA